jgi:hypothetical protein
MTRVRKRLSDKTKKGISNTAVAVAGIYGFVALIMYVYPGWGPTVLTMMKPLSEYFLTIPVAIVLGFALLVGPLLSLFLLMIAVEFVAYKLMGLDLE